MKYISDIFLCICFLYTVLSRNDQCKKIESVAGVNLIEKFRTDYLIQSDVRIDNVNNNEFYKQKQLFEITEKFPLNIDGLGEIWDYNIRIDWEKQIFRFSLLIVNETCVTISQSQKFNIYSIANTLLEQPELKTFTTYLIRNASLCNQFDEYKAFNYYVYCFYQKSLNIYTINQENDVELYLEYNFTNLAVDSKKKIIFMKQLNKILFITYNKDKCEIYQIDNEKQGQVILEINKNTHNYEEILMIHFYQDRFLQIYFNNETLMFDIFMQKLQIHSIQFQSTTNKIENSYTIKLSKNQQEKFLIDNTQKYIILSCEHEIPQFLIYQSKLMLIYSQNVEIIEFGLIRQLINISIKQIYSLSSNYLIGIDNSDNIFIVKLNLISRNYRVSSLNETPLILQHYRITKFKYVLYYGCYQVYLITQEQKEIQRKQNNTIFLEQKHFLTINAQNKNFFIFHEMIFPQQNFYIQTIQNQKFQITNKKSQNILINRYIDLSLYFVYGPYDTYIQCQDNKLITIYYESTNQVERYKLSCDSQNGKIYNFKQSNLFCVVTQDNYGINKFSFKSINTTNYKVEYKGRINLTNQIINISSTGKYLVANHKNCSISLFDKQIRYLGTKSLFIGKYTDFCYIESYIIINDEKSIVFYQVDKIAIKNYLNNSIFKIQIDSIVCFESINRSDKTIYICVHKYQQILYTYELEYDELIQISEITIINYQIYRPLDYQIYQNSIVIVSTQNDQLFLLYFILQDNLMLELNRIIKIFNLNYNLDHNLLSYSSEKNIEHLPFLLYKFHINEQISNQSESINLTFLVDFVENFTQILHNFTLELKINQIMEYPELIDNHPKKFVPPFNKLLNFNVNEFIYGPIENIQLLNQQYVVLIQPHIVQYQQKVCQLTICIYNDDFKYLLIYDKLTQTLFNTSLQVEAQKILIAYLNIQNILIFVLEQDGLLQLYYDNQKQNEYEINEKINSVVLQDQLLLIKSSSFKAIVRHDNYQFIIEKYECDDLDLGLIRLFEQNNYLIVIKRNDSTLQLNSTVIRHSNQLIISTKLYQLNSDTNNTCVSDILSIKNINILEVQYKETEQTYSIRVILFQQHFCHICMFQFSQQNFIQSQLNGGFMYPLEEQFSFIVFKDINYLIVQFINGSWLYQISDNYRQNYYPVFQFNQSFTNFNQYGLMNTYINSFNLFGEYQLEFDENNHNITLEFLALYKEQKIYFNVTIEYIETQNSNIQFNLILFFIILTLALMFLLYYYCQKKCQNLNLKQKNLNLELKQAQVEMSQNLEQESRLNQEQ